VIVKTFNTYLRCRWWCKRSIYRFYAKQLHFSNQVYADATLVFPLLLAETFVRHHQRSLNQKKSDKDEGTI